MDTNIKAKLGYVSFVSGFILLVVNAVDYLGGFFGLSSELKLPSSGFAILLVAFGLFMTKKK